MIFNYFDIQINRYKMSDINYLFVYAGNRFFKRLAKLINLLLYMHISNILL